MMDQASVRRAVLKFFQDNHLSCKQDWLDSCLEYFISNNQQVKFEEAKEFALEQWKLGNLREIGEPTLPQNNLRAVKVTELKGIFAVQVEKFWDKANSSYNQYRNYKGELSEETNNDETNEGEVDVSDWGKGPGAGETKRALKPRRLLMEICDGKTELKALEWKPIQELSGMVYPGAKMVIKGPVVCRNGILMLCPEHVKLYGGEVDDLIFTNAMENLIADSLGLPLNNDPYTGKTSTLPPPRKPQPQKPVFRNQPASSTFQAANNGNRFQQKFETTTQNKTSTQKNTNHTGSNLFSRPSNFGIISPMDNKRRKNFFDDPNFSGQSSLGSKFSSPLLKKTEVPSNSTWEDDLDDFELSAEDLAQLESFEKQQSQKVTRKRQTPSPVADFDFEDDAMEEIQRLEQKARASKRPHLEPPSNSQPLARIRPIVKNERREEPIEDVPPKRPLVKTPNLKTFLSRTVTAKKMIPPEKIIPPKQPTKIKVSTRPFIYLKQLQGKWRKRATIKATIISLLKKLSTTNQRWSLTARITDSTAFLDVDFGNRILEKMMGIKCKDFLRSKLDRERKTKLVGALKSKLIDCDCLMVLKFQDNKLPKVIKLKKVGHKHVLEFKTRQRTLDRSN
ncbi:recQ-mediated genome instability protein 1-like isoform X2 [Neocloeon triangulifer]|uniref:recQ-mediated genome instability protein 1-like isoform X2 n=1 Tax=Neocloeon triangulifer TaxID=2078957 RepID=UPI00286F2C75|nr:recQ-mediated genome instability protein 1-like isoform X2 [Neocloeon triangulifer]